MKENKRKIIRVLLIAFMILQPIFDIFYLYNDNVISMFKFSPATIVRMIVMIVLFLGALVVWKVDKKKKIKWLIAISILYGLYVVGHHFHVSSFNVSYGNLDNYSTIKELFYMIRMIMPFLMVFVTYESDITWKNIKRVIFSTVFIFSIVMIFTNIFKVAINSYNDGVGLIKVSFFQWFIPGIYEKYGYEFIASKGIFHMANQVSGTLVCLLPLVIYTYFEEKFSCKNILMLACMLLAMLMLGTRVASFGWIAVLVVMCGIYLLFCLIIKKASFEWKKLLVLLGVMGVFLAILPFSPVLNRKYINDESSDVEELINDEENKKETNEFFNKISELESAAETEEDWNYIYDLEVNFIKEHWEIYRFDKDFILEIYPYTEDCDFWVDLLDVPFADRANHRQLKTLITRRVVELNDNNLDYVFGISFSRLRNGLIYMENDILVHLYSIGILGIILFILPYFLIVVYAIIKMLRNKNMFSFLNLTYLFSIGLVFVAGIMSGNIFDEWIATLFLAFICGNLLVNVTKK